MALQRVVYRPRDAHCPNCGGRLQLIATIVDPRTIRALLLSLGVRAEVAERAPPVFGAPA